MWSNIKLYLGMRYLLFISRFDISIKKETSKPQSGMAKLTKNHIGGACKHSFTRGGGQRRGCPSQPVTLV